MSIYNFFREFFCKKEERSGAKTVKEMETEDSVCFLGKKGQYVCICMKMLQWQGETC